jgi:hypothetical protein
MGEILKSENVDEQRLRLRYCDYKPLQTVSKIGSEPILEKKDIVEETLQSYTYLQSLSKKY